MSLAANDPTKFPSEQVAAEIRRRISDGKYPTGRLPSTRELAAEFGIAPQTLRNGLRPLVAEGLIFSEGNRGYFITKLVPRDSAEGTEAAPTMTAGIGEELARVREELADLRERVAALEGR
ncbi:GntR family transcriptional regulator [Kitasatospora sp. GAS1066B]|uniref:GntR family transcriptional regulator n=1 Tax=Kitasatospora sp. GAS1066B TaxID=3156271 RepID=UPI003513AA37